MKLYGLVALSAISLSAGAQEYWQQKVDTKIEVRLDDQKHLLHGKEQITYTNNSNDTLKVIYMHVWPNAYKNDETPFAQQMEKHKKSDFYYSKAQDKGYIDSLDFTVDGKSIDFYLPESTPDIAKLELKKPLLPHQSIKIETPFLVKIPKVFSRLGHTGNAYFVSQWFPKPAVYDKKGWHPIPYLNLGEFYSEYGSYDVAITLPKNYIVMATGNCTDAFENAWMDSLANKPMPSDTTKANIESSVVTKTLHFHEDNVHDFAWFADKRWIVRKDTVFSPGNNKLVTTWTAFLPVHQKQWAKGCDYLKTTVKHYGEWVGPYQYNTIKAVEGDMFAGGGMEYPTVTIIDRESAGSLSKVIIHEAGHNWFYGMLGSNERDHAWMDEGLNTFHEQKTSEAIRNDTSITLKGKKSGISINIDESVLYGQGARVNDDQPIEMTSEDYTSFNYGIDIYYKTGIMLRYLESYMGEADYIAGMKNYYDKWHFKHPQPEDFQRCMQEKTSKNIDWLFKNMFTTDKEIDFSIVGATKDGSTTKVTVKNKSGLAAPIKVEAYKNKTQVGSAWAEPFKERVTLTLPVTDWDYLKIDSLTPDAHSYNNYYKNGGLSHRYGLALKPFLGFNLGKTQPISWMPSMAYNQYDGFMLGLALHNITFPENHFRFAATPLYGFGSQTFNGALTTGYFWYPKRVKEVELQGDFKTFHYNESLKDISSAEPIYARYMKSAVGLNILFNQPNSEGHNDRLLSPIRRSLLIKAYSITEEQFNFGTSTTLNQVQNIYGLVRYKHENTRLFNPYSYKLEGQVHKDFAKLSFEGNAKIDYNTKKKALYARVFLGKYFKSNNEASAVSRYSFASSFQGVNDYLYDGTYIGRNAGDHVAAQQISIQEGGFKIPVYGNVDRSSDWIATLNLTSDLPIKLPLRLFLDAGFIPNTNPTPKNNSAASFIYDGGVELKIIDNVLSIYCPLIKSSDYQNYLQNTYGGKAFARGISFTLMLQNLNFLKTTSYILKNSGA